MKCAQPATIDLGQLSCQEFLVALIGGLPVGGSPPLKYRYLLGKRSYRTSPPARTF